MPSRRQLNHIPINYHRVLEFGSGMTVTSTYNAGPRGGKTEITTISSAASGHTVTYGSLAPVTAGTSVGQEYIQTSNGTSTGILMNTWVWDGTAWYNNDQPINLTRAQLLTLRNASQLRQSQHYLITDHVQGRLVAGTTILVHATADNEISENVTVNTTYDNEGWRGIYDADRALVLELEDNRNNIARGFNGVEVSNFDWGNTSYTNVTVDNATLTVNIGNTAGKVNVVIEKNASVNLTNFTGNLNNITFTTSAIANLTGANGTWRLSTIAEGSSFNISGYTGGGDNYYNNINGASGVNFSNSTSLVIFRQNEISAASTITHSGVSTGTFTLTTSKVFSSTITHSAGSGTFSATSNNNIVSGSIINHTTGTVTLSNVYIHASTITQDTNAGAIMTLNQAHIEQGCTITNRATGTMSVTQSTISKVSSIQRLAGATGNTTVNFSDISGSSNVIQQATNTGTTTLQYCILKDSSQIINGSAAVISIVRTYIKALSNIQAVSGSGGTINVSDTDIFGSSSISKQAVSTTGTISVSGGTKISSNSFIQSSGIGNLTVAQGSFDGASGINVTAGDRNYSFTRIVQSGVARANLSGTGAAINDLHNEFEMHYRGTYTNSCSGAANSINYTECSGLSGALTLLGTTGGSSLSRIKLRDGSFTKNNNPNAGSYNLWNISDASTVSLAGHAAGETINYIDVSNNSALTINKTGAGVVQQVQIKNSGTVNILGTTGVVAKLDVEQGTVVINAGSIQNVSKKMVSTLTINAGAQTNVHHWNTVNKTATVANNARIDYLGVVSSVPIL